MSKSDRRVLHESTDVCGDKYRVVAFRSGDGSLRYSFVIEEGGEECEAELDYVRLQALVTALTGETVPF